MEEITIKHFVERTPHIKTMHDVQLYAIYVYANVTGVYRCDDPQKTLIPFSNSDEECRTRARLLNEATEVCRANHTSYATVMYDAVIEFRSMSIEEKMAITEKIF